MLSPEFSRFCNQWIERANRYGDQSIDDSYDKFFTCFVVFNRLYAEATFELARRGEITLPPNRPLPDKKGATDYTLKTIGIQAFQSLYDTSLAPHAQVIENLIDTEQFYIKLSSPNGDRQRDKDLELLAALRSDGERKFLALLETVYTIRCNLFHGHKGFQQVQTTLLRPTTAILCHVIEALRNELST